MKNLKMKIKKKLCNKCGELKVIWKNHKGSRYCQACWKLELPKSSQSNKPTARQKPISRVSARRAKEEKIYSKQRLSFLKLYPVCQANLNGCTTKSTDVHHKSGRTGYLYLDESKWLAVCRACHMWIETHPKEARQIGFSISRLKIEDDIN